ncbi:phytanoyl-CoA dioxygenase [Thecamonas trahens ATCC 50062]|uniref:Phytanoyl-CoA dioxygenase n=1 Tax=Thecamonas trahens ATCC 50062 TaxID=461836 RepID=A0A0L0D5B1_THETB|nr:phytanoyl-CoA dioxygenase [Thecamonas trahens ATCC 50062]KNC47390.1 phytanoyl-CoA dioxygenase [Thecamonas trahens ATCC 50062]|eukprot:XP_013759728.1 phytanoyl-CoA dioxygenase [Thecamonas trahens ATCC 50062]
MADQGENSRRPLREEDVCEHVLSPDDMKRFHADGYLVLPWPVLEAHALDAVRQTAEELMVAGPETVARLYEHHANETGDEDAVLFHCLGGWRVASALADLVYNPAIIGPVSQLLPSLASEDGAPRAGVRLWHDQLFCKPGGIGGPVAWHQDMSYWTRTAPAAHHLTIHVALDDQNHENGGLYVVPGSQTWDLLPVTSRHFDDMDSIHSVLTSEQSAAFHPHLLGLKAGYASIHHSHTVHGSWPNTSSAPRRAAAVNVIADGVYANDDSPLLAGVPPVPCGEPLVGEYFPLLFEP